MKKHVVSRISVPALFLKKVDKTMICEKHKKLTLINGCHQ